MWHVVFPIKSVRHSAKKESGELGREVLAALIVIHVADILEIPVLHGELGIQNDPHIGFGSCLFHHIEEVVGGVGGAQSG
jgi:hypothetical protein